MNNQLALSSQRTPRRHRRPVDRQGFVHLWARFGAGVRSDDGKVSFTIEAPAEAVARYAQCATAPKPSCAPLAGVTERGGGADRA